MHERNFFFRIALIYLFSVTASTALYALGIDNPMTPSRVINPLNAGYLDRAKQMYEEKNYAGAIDQINFIFENNPDLSEDEAKDCLWLIGCSLFERGDEECVAKFNQLAERWPGAKETPEARLKAGDFYFFSHDYASALTLYLRADERSLDRDKQLLYAYRKAYCLLRTGHISEARECFESLKTQSDYILPATYYIAYTDYVNGNYREAYSGFQKTSELIKLRENSGAKKDETTEGLCPEFYMLQMDYERGEYDTVAEQGKRLLWQGAPTELIGETERVVGLSLFKKGDFGEAKPYLVRYLSTADFSTGQDAAYAMGAILYAEEDYPKAKDFFLPLAGEKDATGQSANLYLGQIEIQEGDNEAAAIYFRKAADMNVDPKITETAEYNYIATRTMGASLPFTSSLPLYTDFLARYPDSEYSDEVEEHLASIYYNEKDYQNALRSINMIGNPDNDVLEAKQKILYELGIESMTSNRLNDARRYFNESVGIGVNRKIESEAYLWLGDAFYAMEDFPGAEKAYKSAIEEGIGGSNKALAYYDLAYAQYMTGNYKASAPNFSRSLELTPGLPKNLRDDAMIRLADTQYYNGQYRDALRNYTEAIDNKAGDSDYAYYRRAMMRGLGGDTKTKLRELDDMAVIYPDSKWKADALLEKARTYAALGDAKRAGETLEFLKETYSETPQARSGMLELAMNYMETGNETGSVRIYKEIIEKWPTSTEASLADHDLRIYYSDRGSLDNYERFLEGIDNAPTINSAQKEQLAFESALKKASEEEPDLTLLNKYINEYADGYHLPEALLLKATILEEKGVATRAEALETYRELEKRGGPEFASRASAGIMHNSDNPDERLKYASLVKNSQGLPAETVQEALLIEAENMLASENRREGERILRNIAANAGSESGAEATVKLAAYLMENGRDSEAEDVLKSFTEEGTTRQYWLARGYILLADIYFKTGKENIARGYMMSLKENYPGDEPDIHDMIETRIRKWGRSGI